MGYGRAQEEIPVPDTGSNHLVHQFVNREAMSPESSVEVNPRGLLSVCLNTGLKPGAWMK